ncbi:alpha-1,3/alpha-1,6-mannosyltransferase, glycosyltransferase family 4 protein [Pseudohyphozyma bogoriensis]|nr:alpha-1,3/alpha-1,6-mannosyltransferase, glycosyltransferase family 4 protein [Pseudohyphozyma bogoriensis]
MNGSPGYGNSSPFTSAQRQRAAPRPLPPKLRIAFIHPDLGIGTCSPLARGAERLVVDAAVGLQARGHHVEVFTSHHQDGPRGRSFEETRDGTLKVHVLGNSIFPPSLLGRFTIICAILRQFHLTLSFLLATLLYHLSSLPILSSFILPQAHPFTSSSDWSPRRQLAPFDVVVVDQLSASIPLLRWLGANRVVFYCHFPDLLLSPSRSAHEHITGARDWSLRGQLRGIYRAPIDRFEETTTGEADKILVNSRFTQGVFGKTFATMGRVPRVVYPGIDVDAYGKEVDVKEADEWLVPTQPTLLSINRFELKKDVELAVASFARAREAQPNLQLILAGGYDPRLPDNVSTLAKLQELATSLELTHYTYAASPLKPTDGASPDLSEISTSPPTSPSQVLFLLNMTNDHKALLLSSTSVVALLYTPSYEHLGIVPLEAMASGLPVLATDTGGPTETIVDAGLEDPSTTGLLRVPSAEVWATALKDLLALSPERRREIGSEGQRRTRKEFSVAKLAQEMEVACKDAAAIGDSVYEEVGFMKCVAFFSIGAFVATAGVIAFWLGGRV